LSSEFGIEDKTRELETEQALVTKTMTTTTAAAAKNNRSMSNFFSTRPFL